MCQKPKEEEALIGQWHFCSAFLGPTNDLGICIEDLVDNLKYDNEKDGNMIGIGDVNFNDSVL